MGGVLAIIPARGGSKGIPGKNLKEICGHPLISWTIVQAIEELGEENVLVSTDDEEIFKSSAQYGHIFNYIRPKKLAKDTSPTEPCMLHALEWYCKTTKKDPDYLMLLQPTSPVRKKDRLKEIINFAQKGSFDSALSVCETHSFFWKNTKNPSASYDIEYRPRRQDIEECDKQFKETGSIYLTKTEFLRTNKNRLGGKIGLFEMDPVEAYEIDTPLDFSILGLISEYSDEFSSRFNAA